MVPRDLKLRNYEKSTIKTSEKDMKSEKERNKRVKLLRKVNFDYYKNIYLDIKPIIISVGRLHSHCF